VRSNEELGAAERYLTLSPCFHLRDCLSTVFCLLREDKYSFKVCHLWATHAIGFSRTDLPLISLAP